MNVAIDLSPYDMFLKVGHYHASDGLSLPWFDGCCFDSDEWVLKSERNAQKTWTLKLANEPIDVGGMTLRESPDLLQTIKIFLVLSWMMKKGYVSISSTSPEGIYKTYNIIIGFVRYLRQVIGISNLSSINKSVSERIINDYLNKTNEQRLNIENRAIESICYLFDDPVRLSDFKIYRLGQSKPVFDHTAFMAELGLSPRSAQSCQRYQEKRIILLKKHGFSYKKNSKLLVENTDTKTVQTSDTIRKSLHPILGLFKAVYIFSSIFPESQRLKEYWLSGINISGLSKRHASAKRGKTRNIPRQVFYRLMDEAIRWVLDYSEDLLAFKKKALKRYSRYLDDLNERESKASDASRRHYVSKKMTEWFKYNQPDFFPFSINSIERSFAKTGGAVDLVKVAEAKSLRLKGNTYLEVAREMGCSKATAHRWCNYTPPIEGNSLQRVINKHLVSACLLVTFAFTGRRKDEIMGLKTGCIQKISDSYFIVFDQEKVGKGDRLLPTTKLVATSINLLEKISEDARSKDSSNKLLKLPSIVNENIQDAWPDFNDFCDYCSIEALDEYGHSYSFSDHQFRRFLAMSYYYRYDDADLPSLSWFLGHESVDMTMHYITDEDGQWAFKSVKNERIIDLVEEELKSCSESVVGSELDEIFGQIDTQTESRIQRMERKERLADQYILSFVPDGACFGRTENIKSRSKCFENNTVQLSAASIGSCSGCHNLIPVEQPMSLVNINDLISDKSPILAAAKLRGVSDV
ncbi:site-specific integrase [Oceanospirillum sanctuarii]|uniref:site-specific integrase n=1 Tax=Oceanospirillum sanctuarii TaxID=1434821 RepID=UPI000A3896E2|nr:site-specific integrase [Oceanospirillum sanctuarii]